MSKKQEEERKERLIAEWKELNRDESLTMRLIEVTQELEKLGVNMEDLED